MINFLTYIPMPIPIPIPVSTHVSTLASIPCVVIIVMLAGLIAVILSLMCLVISINWESKSDLFEKIGLSLLFSGLCFFVLSIITLFICIGIE